MRAGVGKARDTRSRSVKAQGRPARGVSVSRSRTKRDPTGRSYRDRAAPVRVDSDRPTSTHRGDTGRAVGPDSLWSRGTCADRHDTRRSLDARKCLRCRSRPCSIRHAGPQHSSAASFTTAWLDGASAAPSRAHDSRGAPRVLEAARPFHSLPWPKRTNCSLRLVCLPALDRAGEGVFFAYSTP